MLKTSQNYVTMTDKTESACSTHQDFTSIYIELDLNTSVELNSLSRVAVRL